MQKITFEDLPSTDSPINATNLNLLQTNVENALNKLYENTYSTTETVVGKYKGKPLYRKVVEATLDLRSSGAHYYDGGLSNIDDLVDLKYKLISGIFQQTFNNAVNAVGINNSNNIYLYTNVAWDNNMAFTFIVEYTKTTDVAE